MSDLIRREDVYDVLKKVNIAEMPIYLFDKLWNGVRNLPSVEPERKWISVTEALPKNYEQTICIDSRGKMMIGMYGEYGWTFPCYMTKPVAWMPLPEPAKIGDGK